MIPASYDIELYPGDTYFGPLITLPSLVPFGGPADLTAATVTAQIRKKPGDADPIASFEVEKVDAAARKLRLKLPAATTAAFTFKAAYWDLQVEAPPGEKRTPLAGAVTIPRREVTRP